MVKLILCLTVLLSSVTMAGQCTPDMLKEFNTISPKQHMVLAEAYVLGMKHDLGYTMMAIAWAESRAGKYLINTQTQDFGVMGINLSSAANREGIRGAFSRNVLAQKLLFNHKYNMDMALKELLYWKGYHKGHWRNIVSSYNAGFNVKAGKPYLTKIIQYTKMFMNC